jgi:hypothetical protein
VPDFQLTTPVAFIIFNRPDTTELVFREIAKAKPTKLLVVGDGARANKEGEASKVAACRAIIKRVDWDCEVLTNFSDVNMGCKLRVSTGLDWVFELVEEAIILEDDCLPHPTFFRFCEELLVKYRGDQRVGMISGDNFQFGQTRNHDSYYFSKYTHIWGWATWRDKWQTCYDVELKKWPLVRDGNWLQDVLSVRAMVLEWTKIFENVYSGKIDTWDYQWVFANLVQGRVNIMPNVNLISNIGFGRPDATHTLEHSDEADIPTCSMIFPLTHPCLIVANQVADNFEYRKLSSKRLYNRVKKIFKVLIK